MKKNFAHETGSRQSDMFISGSGHVRAHSRKILSIALAMLIAWTPTSLLLANPEDGVVAAGGATISGGSGHLEVQQLTDRAVIDWRGFDIGAGETTQFIQPSSSSMVLNRVHSNAASMIDGRLQANGNVVIVNPNGVWFGANARVDVNGLIASTADISNNAFMNSASTLDFDTPGNPDATITNEGIITAKDAGLIGFVAPSVINRGTINARLGKVSLASGDTATVDFYGDGLLRVAVSDAVTRQLVNNSGTINAESGVIALTAAQGKNILNHLVQVEGELNARSVTQHNGKIIISGRVVSNRARVDVSGASAGDIDISAYNLLQQGELRADSTTGKGGNIRLNYTHRFIDSEAARVSATSHDGQGGDIRVISQTPGSRATLSGHYDARSYSGLGGTIDVTGKTVSLFGASLNTSGALGGGRIRIGGDYQGGADLAHADDVKINFSTTLDASATQHGNGGSIIMWADNTLGFAGTALAKGGANSGNGGLIEISAKDTQPVISSKAIVDASSPHGQAGALLFDPKNITISTSGSMSVIDTFQFIDPNPDGYGLNNYNTVLTNGNVVVTKWEDSFNGTGAGAVYLYNGTTGALISTLLGSNAYDYAGNGGINLLTNGNFVVLSQGWNGYRGAVSWASATAGVSGVISATNSLVGVNASDYIGVSGITNLNNGNYLINSYYWNGYRGAVTWVNGATGIVGNVSAANSLVGTNANDYVGIAGTIALSNGNYVVNSYYWNGNRGAVTWGNGTTGIVGAVSSTNSLVGTNANDYVGISGVTVLTNGNYLVASHNWNGNRGAVTWANGTTGIVGNISSTNSLIGSLANDYVGSNIFRLSNNNYVVRSHNWNGRRGAVTWGSGTTGVVGTVSATNSIVGSLANDYVGIGNITELANGNYIVSSQYWNGNRGAVRLASSTGSTVGTITSANSLVGVNANDYVGNYGITTLANGNYLIRSGSWNGNRGAVTLASGTTGIVGNISSANSLVGVNANDYVGSGGITQLSNGNYLIQSPNWNGNRGAVTWANGTTGVVGNISAANSLVGSTANDSVGTGGVTVLANGSYVVSSPYWNGYRGAVTWTNSATGIVGTVSSVNSLVGVNTYDYVGLGGVTLLASGNYLINSYYWNGYRGAVTWVNGTTGIVGNISAANSLIGSNTNEFIGAGGVILLNNGNYVINSSSWNGYRGAVTWASGTTGIVGNISSANSLVGVNAFDQLGNGGVTALSNGNYIVLGFNYNGSYGSATLLDGSRTTIGSISADNTIFTSTPFVDTPGDNSYVIEQTGIGRVLVFFADYDPYADELHSLSTSLVTGNTYTFGYKAGDSVNLHPDFITATLNNGTAVTLQASNDITVSNAITAINPTGNGGALTLQAGRSIILNASITTDNGALRLYGNVPASDGVVDAQRDAGNAVITMASGVTLNAGTGAIDIQLFDGAGKTNRGAGDITLRSMQAGNIFVRNHNIGGDILIASGALTATGTGDAIRLVSSRNFVNNAGAGALSTSAGRWLVYSTSPASDNTGSLANTFRRFSCAFGGSCPSTPASGNGFMYTTTPTLTVTPTALTGIAYGTATPGLTGYTYSLSGYLDSDASADIITGSINGATNYSAGSSIGNYTLSHASGALTSTIGYGFSYTTNTAALSVTPRTLTVTANASTKIYGDADPSLSYTITSGALYGSDTLTGGLARAFGENVGNYGISQNTLTAGNNYALSYAGANLSITPASLTISAIAQSKTYGDADARLIFDVTGLKNSDTNSILNGNLQRVAGENIGSYSIQQGSLTASANYRVDFNASTLDINPATLTVTAEDKHKVYGSNDPRLTYTLKGLANGDDASVVKVALVRDTGNAVGRYAILGKSISATFNYILKYVSGVFTINDIPDTVTRVSQNPNLNIVDTQLSAPVAVSPLIRVSGTSTPPTDTSAGSNMSNALGASDGASNGSPAQGGQQADSDTPASTNDNDFTLASDETSAWVRISPELAQILQISPELMQ